MVIRKRATFGPGVRAHGPQSQFRFGSFMHPCGKLLDVCLTPSTVMLMAWYKDPDGKLVKIWASGTVKRVADGLTNTRSARAKKILPAGALLWAWDADPDRNEAAGTHADPIPSHPVLSHPVHRTRHHPNPARPDPTQLHPAPSSSSGERWLVLLPEKWNKHVQYAWRFDPCELAASAATATGARPAPRRPHFETSEAEEEFS